MGKARKGFGVLDATSRHRRVIAYVLAFAMAAELVPAQSIRGMLRVRGVAVAEDAVGGGHH